VATRLTLWRVNGVSNLKQLLAKMGVALREAQQSVWQRKHTHSPLHRHHHHHHHHHHYHHHHYYHNNNNISTGLQSWFCEFTCVYVCMYVRIFVCMVGWDGCTGLRVQYALMDIEIKTSLREALERRAPHVGLSHLTYPSFVKVCTPRAPRVCAFCTSACVCVHVCMCVCV
jgi:hypothetical protein